jgi:S1-C subfamily serine protease
MNEEMEKVKREPSKGRSQLLAIVLVVLLALGAGFGGGIAAMRYRMGGFDFNLRDGSAIGGASEIQINVREDVTIAEAIAQKVLPSVVGISTVTEQEAGSFFGFGDGYKYDAQSIGTGVIVHENGYILTNSHVVNDGDTKSLTVSLFDGSDVEGTVLWSDANLDLAVVKVEASDLVVAEMGDSDEVSIGAYAAAIGNPLGLDFERSMSQGIISGLNRSIAVGSGGGSSGMEGLMQTDATINSGNSGGPLLNSRGQVIGINTAKAASGEGMGFAIPINVAKPIVAQIMENGTFKRAYIGITGVGLEEQTYYSAEELLAEFGTNEGIYVASVLPGGGAEAAGLLEGDVILRFQDEEVGTMNRLNTMLVAYRPGDQVELFVLRSGSEQIFRVTLTDGTAAQ